MLSGYFTYQVLTITGNFWVALIVAPVVTAFLGIILERFFIRRVHEFGHVGELILTVGIALIILDAVKVFWGTESLPVKVPPILDGLVYLWGIDYPIYRLFVIGIAVLVLGIMIVLLYKSRLGKIVRAAVTDADMVNALGVNIPVVFMFVFGFGTWLAGVAAVAIAPILTVYPGLADQVGMDAFIVVVTGGFGSLLGAFIVSIIFGLMNSYGVQFISQLAPVLMYAFMAVVLMIRPNGLFGERE
ncbi:MAG: branched-chain amino acid ABC transporter permease [Deltaproteobacteria bacterium]|nr:branched-chain amino acid ABC transporter permease [Deltaproteobacteria bacterium]